MFAELNVWVDIIAIAMIAIPVGFWAFQITGNIATGRYYQKFVKKQWPHHDESVHAKPKIIHATHVALMIALGISGLYTRFPFFEGGCDTMKFVHFVCMYAVIANALIRVHYALKKDAHHFKITFRDIINAPNVFLYYTFLRKSYPHLTKYNIMQKMTYGLVFPSLMVVQALTGFSLMWPELLLGWTADYAGGIAAAAAWMRVAHFMSAMGFLMMTMIHAFLAITEDMPGFLSFFGLAKQEHLKDGQHGNAVTG